jgi:hypothetical protein
MADQKWIDVQVGSDFLIQCDCGWGFRTRDDAELHAQVDAHEAETGHRWPAAGELESV